MRPKVEKGRVNGIVSLKAFAKQRGIRTVAQELSTANVPEELEREARVTHNALKVSVRASASYFLVRISVRSDVVFSVGAANRVMQINQSAPTVESLPMAYFPAGAEFEDERTRASDWLANEGNRALIIGLNLSSGEALHLLANSLSLVLSASRVIDDGLLDSVVALARSVESVRPEPTQDLGPLPKPLRPVVLTFKHLAEADDELRGQISARMSASERQRFSAAMEPLFPSINVYLSTLSHPWPEAAITLASLAELASEIGLKTAKQPAKG